MSEDVLSPMHRRMLEVNSAIPPKLITERGYRTVTSKNELIQLGFSGAQSRVPGLLIPIHGPDGQVVSHQYRPDSPRPRQSKPIKYESLPNTPPRIDVPPRVREELGDPKVPLWITEGSKKADAAAAKGLACVSLSGVWNWRGRNESGGKVALGDFEQVALNGRKVYIAFDSDVTTKLVVQLALERLDGLLKSKGANVQVVLIPAPDGDKAGLDDFFATGGTVEELLSAIATAPTIEDGRAIRVSLATELVELVLKNDVELWHSPDMEPYASYVIEGRPESSKLKSQGFSFFCRSLFYSARKKSINSEALREAIESLSAMAVHEGKCHEIWLRVAWKNDAIYLFLNDEKRQVVEVTSETWRLISASDCPAKFCLSKNSRALPIPCIGGNLEDLAEFLSVDQEEFGLVEGYLIGCFLPEGTYPVLAVSGEQGSGKSFGCRLIRSMIDPVEAPNRSMPRDLSGLASAVAWNHIVTLDNVSGISPQLSDALCGVVSGSGFASRQLYTDAEEHLTIARRPIILNGIEDVIGRADLASRTLLIRFRRINDSGRLPESQLLDQFKKRQSGILGALLDRIVAALADRDTPSARELPRLADLAHWVTASEPKHSQGKFIDQLRKNHAEQNAVAFESEPLAVAVRALVECEGDFEGSSTDLFQLLSEREGGEKGRLPYGWPRSPKALTASIRRLAPVLRATGIACEQGRSGEKRYWRLTLAERADSEASYPSSSSRSASNESEDSLLSDDRLKRLALDVSRDSSPENLAGLKQDQPKRDANDECNASRSMFLESSSSQGLTRQGALDFGL